MGNLKRNLILGCDPGFLGAIAIYNFENKKLVSVFDMPIFELKGRKEINAQKLSSFIDGYADQIRLSVIEDVGVMTGKEGRQSMFRFGVGVGIVRGILSSYMIPIFPVVPSVWKSLENLSGRKAESITRARKLFPDSKAEFLRSKDDGRAEAAILARFGERFLNLG